MAKKKAGKLAINPAAAYPATLPLTVWLFIPATSSRQNIRNGAFIAFHGSWNRAPEPQAGFFVVFQPFKDGMLRVNGKYLLTDLQAQPQIKPGEMHYTVHVV